MRIDGNPESAIQPNRRNHPGHTDLIRARVDGLVRYLSHGKCDPAHPGKRARDWWAKAYGHLIKMHASPAWWKANQPKQYAIIYPEGGEPLDYRELNVAYLSLPKHPINVEKMRAELTTRIRSATLSPADMVQIRGYLRSYDRDNDWPLWWDLVENYRVLQRIANGKLEGHSTEFGGASDFDPSLKELAAEYDLEVAMVSALRKGLYLLVRENIATLSERDPVKAFRTIGVEPERRPRRKTAKGTEIGAKFRHASLREAVAARRSKKK